MSSTITFSAKGDFKKTLNFIRKRAKIDVDLLNTYGQIGVEALASSTPKDTGLTAESWGYRIDQTDTGLALRWYNTNVEDDWCNIAVILQYGHATRNGGWVEGRDYINPTIQPIFDDILKNLWKGVKT